MVFAAAGFVWFQIGSIRLNTGINQNRLQPGFAEKHFRIAFISNFGVRSA